MLIPHCQLLALHISADEGCKKRKRQRKAKQTKLFYKPTYFSRHALNYVKGLRVETNFAVIAEHPDNWPTGKCASAAVLYGPALRPERTCPLLCLSPSQHCTLRRGEAHLAGWGKEWTFQIVTQHMEPSALGKARIERTPHLQWACPSLLVDAFDQCSISGKISWN